MAEYVELDAVVKAGQKVSAPISDIIQGLRTIEVVRCKDCKECFTRANGTNYCRRTGRYAATDDFCSFGERREGE